MSCCKITSVCLSFAAKCWRCFTNALMTLRHYAFSRQHRTQFSEDVYVFVLWRYVAVQIWRVKELFVPGIVASTIKDEFANLIANGNKYMYSIVFASSTMKKNCIYKINCTLITRYTVKCIIFMIGVCSFSVLILLITKHEIQFLGNKIIKILSIQILHHQGL